MTNKNNKKNIKVKKRKLQIIGNPITNFRPELTEVWIGIIFSVFYFRTQEEIENLYETFGIIFPNGAYVVSAEVAYSLLKEKNPDGYKRLIALDSISFQKDNPNPVLLFNREVCRII